MIWALKACLVSIATLVATAFFVIPLYLGGYVSREIVAAASPDGQREAVCRGWLPDQTEYELWVRRRGEWFGQRVGPGGGESAGRCGAVAWSDDGRLVAVSSLSGLLYVYDAVTLQPHGHQFIRQVGNPGTIPTPRMVTAMAFQSSDRLQLTLCDRVRSRSREVPYYQCGASVSRTLVSLDLQPVRVRARRW